MYRVILSPLDRARQPSGLRHAHKCAQYCETARDPIARSRLLHLLELPLARGGVLGGDLPEHLLEEDRVGDVGLEVVDQVLRRAAAAAALQEGAQPRRELRRRALQCWDAQLRCRNPGR